jgi:16S rRNA (uracil1498-N3)-methyltransferase
VRLPAEESHHIRKVLRARPGSLVEAVDASGRLFTTELVSGDVVRVIQEEVRPQVGSGELTLYQAVPKGKRMELVVEKAVELGVDRIVPLTTERGVVRPDGKGGKQARWARISEAAARQALRLKVPEVAEVASFPDAVREPEGSKVLLHNDPGVESLEALEISSPVSVFVGPEGGWSEQELRTARDAGAQVAHLGPYRLRSETAGIAAVSRVRTILEGRQPAGEGA